ncbi:unnamed protein product [Adineta steineri]|uniref:Uncharacterized protein n=1 Tax=Adineta steineri TaxID=433720 RepID=A0A818M883_9BILA|nr:unnamed protein product [Adineta steineri]
MTKITIITQNFSSPDDFNDTPLMLLPQTPLPPPLASDKDHDGFTQLLLHDRHRQRQTYTQSYTAFETLKKRQDFVLRQESLRSLQVFIDRMATKQDQSIDQSFRSYRQCFGKFINIKSTHKHLHEQDKRPRTAGPSYEQFPSRQLLHVPATPLDPPLFTPFHRYQKSHRPSSSTKYRMNTNTYRGGKSRQDNSFRSASFISHSQPFVSFTEDYFHKHNERPSSKSQTIRSNYNERSLTKFPMPSNIDTNRPSSQSQRLRYNRDERQSNKFHTPADNHDDQLISKPQIITTNTNRDERSSNKFHTPAADNNDDNQLISIPQIITTNNNSDDELVSKPEITTNKNDDQLISKPQISTINNNNNDESANKVQITTHINNDPPVNQSPVIKTNDDVGLLNEVVMVTNNNNNDQSLNKPAAVKIDDNMKIDEIRKEVKEEKEQQQARPVLDELKSSVGQDIKEEDELMPINPQPIRVSITSRIINTPTTTPQMGYNDAVRDGLLNDFSTQKPRQVQDYTNKTPIINVERRLSQQTNNSNSKISTKRPKTAKKKHTIVVALPMETKAEAPTEEFNDNESLATAITVQNYANNTPEQPLPTKTKRRKPSATPTTTTTTAPTNLQIKKTPPVVSRPSVKFKDDTKENKDTVKTQMITTVANEQKEPIVEKKKEEIPVPVPPIPTIIPESKVQVELIEDVPKRIRKSAFDSPEFSYTPIHVELKPLGSHRNYSRKTRSHLDKTKNQSEKVIEPNPETIELLEKIKRSEIGSSIGTMSVSKQGCRFELPSDLKKLENLNPIEYISKYCRLSLRRNYQFKRIFDKYRNNKYCLDITNLYSAITDIHTENFTRAQYDYLLQLLDIENQQHQFSFETFGGILAVCERIVYDSLNPSSDVEDYELGKDPLEKCDFDSLLRKLDGFAISETMKKLLKTL